MPNSWQRVSLDVTGRGFNVAGAGLKSRICFLLDFFYELTLFYLALTFYLNKLLKFHKEYIIPSRT